MIETWGVIAERIYDTLKKNGYQHLIDDKLNELGIGGTAGEEFSITCVWLAKMRNSKEQGFELIKTDANILLDYSVDIKYFTRHYLDKI